MIRYKDLGLNLPVQKVGGLDQDSLLPANTLDCEQAKTIFEEYLVQKEKDSLEALNLLIHCTVVNEHHGDCPALNKKNIEILRDAVILTI